MSVLQINPLIRIEQAAAQMSLIDEQMARCRIIAPFDGVVMSGDLSQSLGAPVERGQVLFEVAPLNKYRVIVEVDELDISAIVVGQKSDLTALHARQGISFCGGKDYTGINC